MAGSLLYWFGWMWWIIVMFFWKKSKKQRWTSIFILILLSISSFSIEVKGIPISLGYIVLAFYMCVRIKEYRLLKLLAHLLISWTIGAAYSGFQFLLLYDPVIG